MEFQLRDHPDLDYSFCKTIAERDRYFDVFVEYAKLSPEDILIQISVSNRGPEAAKIDPNAISQNIDRLISPDCFSHNLPVNLRSLLPERDDQPADAHTTDRVRAPGPPPCDPVVDVG